MTGRNEQGDPISSNSAARATAPAEPASAEYNEYFFDRLYSKQRNVKEGRSPWLLNLPFAAVHLACLAVFWVGISKIAVFTCLALYFVRMFSLVSFYHRYFAHRSFKTSRVAQFIFALMGTTCTQNGPLWWAAHHRRHHQFSDKEGDVHSPVLNGFFWSHVGWVLSRKYDRTDFDRIRDFARFPELRFINQFDLIAPVSLAAGLFFLGSYLGNHFPSLGTSAGQMLVWGYFVSTTLLYHGTFTINSLSHVWGARRFKTDDESRNNPWLAMITLGEGWHNNHHRYMASIRQGFYWWEYDIAFYILRGLSWMGIIWDLKLPPKEVLAEGRKRI